MTGTYITRLNSAGTVELGGDHGNDSIVFGAGTSSSRVSSSAASVNFVEFRFENSAPAATIEAFTTAST